MRLIALKTRVRVDSTLDNAAPRDAPLAHLLSGAAVLCIVDPRLHVQESPASRRHEPLEHAPRVVERDVPEHGVEVDEAAGRAAHDGAVRVRAAGRVLPVGGEALALAVEVGREYGGFERGV